MVLPMAETAGGWMHVSCHEATDGLGVSVASGGPNENACWGALGEIRKGERFSPGELCQVVGRRKKSDISPPGMARVPRRLRASVRATCS
jgi:hypothetical protein